MPEQESEKTRADTWFEIGKLHAECGCMLRDAPDFEFHADWQNYLAGVRAAVL